MLSPAPTTAVPAKKPRLRWFLWLLLALVGCDSLLSAHRDLWRKYAADEYREKLRGCRHRTRDIIVLGGSPVNEGIDPAHLVDICIAGHRMTDVYSLSLPGATLSDFWFALKNGTREPPKTLIYGISATDMNDRRNEPHGPASLMTWGDWSDWIRTRPESASWVTRQMLAARSSRVWQLWRYRRAIRLWAADEAETRFPGSFTEAAREARRNREEVEQIRRNHGFSPRPDFMQRSYAEMKAAGWVAPTFSFLENYETGSHLKYLDRMLAWAKQNRVELVLVDMPVTADLEARYPEIYRRYREMLDELERVRGVRIIRTDRRTIGLDDSHFADLIHLNSDGATRFSGWLRRQLDEGYPPGDVR